MLKFLKFLRVRDWIMLAALLAFLIGQIFCDVALPTYTAEIVRKMQAGEGAASILATGKIMLFFAAVSVGATLVETFLSAVVSTSFGKRIRGEVFSHVMTFSDNESGMFTAGSLLTRTTNDVQQVVSALVLGLRLGVGAPLMAVLAIVEIARSTWELTLSTGIGVFLLLTGIITILVIVTPKFRIVQKLTDRLNGVTRENLTGLRVVRAYNAEAYQEKKFEDVNEKFTQTNLFTGRVMAALNPLVMLVNYSITLAIYWIGCYLIVVNNDPAFFPTMFSFSQLAGQVVMAFMVLLMLFMMLPRAQVSAKRISEVLKQKTSVTDPKQEKSFTQEGTVVLDNVFFGYVGARESVIAGLSLAVKKGQTVAIIGATGAGKSTVLKLIVRFMDASNGRVLVNGVDVRDISQIKLHSVIGYVPQKSLLFSGTIAENLSLGNPEMTMDEIKAAARAACAEEFILSLPNGYNSPVSQGGKNFSGGQKQRLCIARAMAIRPQIYLFDDSFSALDYATDLRVRKNLKLFAPEATKIIVAQRIGTIRDADLIVVLDKGMPVGIGTHEELLASCKEYREIAASQFSEEEISV